MTGIAKVGARWVDLLQQRALVRDVSDVDSFATSELLEINNLVTAGHPEASTTTLYHFGFEDGKSVRYTYRSKNGFVGERSDTPAFGVKPDPEGFQFVIPNELEEWVDLAIAIRDEQDSKAEGTIYIGGELFLTHLEPQLQFVRRIHRFDDYDDMWRVMRSAAK